MTSPSHLDEEALHDTAFFGHPRGLSTLFFIELWERFSYYGMRAILLYFLIDTQANGGLGIDPANGTAVVSIYGSAVYLLSVVGGFAADRVIGGRRSVLWGGVIIMAGHVLLAVPLVPTAWAGIATVALGTGMLKPNVSAMVGELYAAHDRRRDGGFSIFYMAVNFGSFFAPIVVGWLRSHYGYHVGFSAAAVGMALALFAYWRGRAALREAGLDVPNPLSASENRRLPLLIAGAVLLLVGLIWIAGLWRTGGLLLQVIDAVTILSLAAPVLYFVTMFRSKQVTARERTHLAAYVPLWLGAMLFWMIVEQAAGKMALFAQNRTVTEVGNVHIDPEWFQSINPLAIIALSPIFAAIWLRRAGKFPSTPAKFAIGVVVVGVAALTMSWAFATFPQHTAPVWVLGSVFLIQTIAELFVSPVGLSATTRLAPHAFAGQALALWYLSSAAGQAIAAQLITAMQSLPDSTYYLINAGITLAFGVVLILLVPWIRTKMGDAEISASDPA